MALKIKKILPSSIEADYWRISQQNMNYDRLDCVVTLSAYINKEARDEGAEPVCSCTFDLSEVFHGKEYDNGKKPMGNINRGELYGMIKQQAQVEADKEEGNSELAFFADSEDI